MRILLATIVMTSAVGFGVSPALAQGVPVTVPPHIAKLFPPPPDFLKGKATPPRDGQTPAPASSFLVKTPTLVRPSVFSGITSQFSIDPGVRRVQNGLSDTAALPLPDASTPLAQPNLGVNEGGGNISMQAALYGALTNNPDLVALRHSNIASPEAVEVARRFPTTLNPTLWIDYRPFNVIPPDTFGGSGTAGKAPSHTHLGQQYIYVSIRQPIELGHQTRYRHAIAKAALTQQQWTVVQAELLSLVQTYRFFQTAGYRREKLRVARQLSEFNDRLVNSLRKRLEANQIAGADVVLAEVENQATRQQVDVARQDYANALADLRNQVGLPETAGTAEPLGEFVLPRNIPPLDESALVQMAIQSRPEIQVARAQAAGALAAVGLARGDRRPTPVVGPLFQKDEVGVYYYGMVLIAPIPILNSGKPLQIQREAEYNRALVTVSEIEKRTVIQVKAAAAKWNAANRLVNQTAGLTASLREQVERMEKLFEAAQTDLTKLLQARQRLIQLENSELDALWQATQAQADLLTALGVPALIAALHEPGPATATPTVATSTPANLPHNSTRR